jgi:hypothetical protein
MESSAVVSCSSPKLVKFRYISEARRVCLAKLNEEKVVDVCDEEEEEEEREEGSDEKEEEELLFIPKRNGTKPRSHTPLVEITFVTGSRVDNP